VKNHHNQKKDLIFSMTGKTKNPEVGARRGCGRSGDGRKEGSWAIEGIGGEEDRRT